MKIHVFEFDATRGAIQFRSPRHVLDFLLHVQQIEHIFHVNKRRLDLPIVRPQPIQRLIKLHDVRPKKDEIADRKIIASLDDEIRAKHRPDQQPDMYDDVLDHI